MTRCSAALPPTSQANLAGSVSTARPWAGRRRDCRRDDASGAEDRPPALLPLAHQSGHRRQTERGHRETAVFDHRIDPDFGYRFLLEETRTCGWARHSEEGTRRRENPGPPVQDDPRAVLTRCDGPARVHRRGRARLLAGVTERRRAADTLYACAIKDVYSHRIVGNSIDSRLRSRIAGSAQNHAVARRTQSLADRVLYIDQVSRAASWPELVHALNRDPWWAR